MKITSSFIQTLLVALAMGIVATGTAFAEKTLVNVDRNGVGIKGYDPVAYFVENRPVKGDPSLVASYGGVNYQFSSEANKARFESNPSKYAPQFGGFCAWAVSRGYTASIDPNAYQIVDGRLLLQYSTSVRAQFSKDTTGNLKKADANWPGIVAKKGK